MKHSVRHSLDQEGAKRAVEAAWAEYSQRFARYSPALDWQSPTRARVGLSAKGMSLHGFIELGPGELRLEMDVPFLMRPFTGRAVAVIEREIKRWVAHIESDSSKG